MFQKLLIANRGEIALRVMRTCRRLGIATVAVYSDADARSRHLTEADEVIHLGPAAAGASYLAMDKIVAAAVETGCQAVHPGYGFLSENAAFARAVENAGLTFIGPPAEAIALLGDKTASKTLAVQAGLPIVPGHPDPVTGADEALEAARGVGFPVLIKPAGGGGGKGMRIVRRPGEMAAALGACREEARKAFGDERLFVERFIERPRHVEVQILADRQGHVVYLGERECSIQRRYQKIIEEAPSTVLTETLRRQMGQAACALAAAAGYVNAGTVEFILDAGGRFYFLEVNTRLQVEHPVTEMVTGLDLVELQLAIATGEPLPMRQEDIQLKGWAIEARICAENPALGFLPATGMITRYAEPRGENIRVDSGIQTGTYVGVYYDSLLAKVICRGADREEARVRLVEALNGYHIEGVTTNLDFVNAIVCHPAFVDGNLYTGFIDDHFSGDRPKLPPAADTLNLAALAATLVYHVRTVAVRESLRPMAPQIGAVPSLPVHHHYMVRAEADLFDIRLNGRAGDRHWQASVNGTPYHVLTPEFEFYRRRLKLTVNGRIHRFRLHFDQSFVQVAFCGVSRRMEIYTPKEWDLMRYMPASRPEEIEHALICPMPGLVVAVQVKKGERVYRGQDLVTLESMKMESGVASSSDAVVAEILVEPGHSVEAGDVLIRFVENDAAGAA